jgi:hypothetical protein
VESIRIDGQTQSRERINEETVTEYAETLLRQGMKGLAVRPEMVWPPVTVYFDGTEFWMADGFHRLLAVKRNGQKHIAADVKKGTREDAAWEACSANQTHGLRRTNADKRKAVTLALGLHAEMSDEAIARHVGVSRNHVFQVRHELNDQVVIGLHPERRIGTDGKSYSLPPTDTERTKTQRLGPPPTPNESRDHEKDEDAPPSAGEEPELPTPPRMKTTKRDTTTDALGRRIPEQLHELWNRRNEVQEMLNELSRVRVILRKGQQSRDPLLSEVPFSSALAHLDQAYNAVQVAKPYAVCAFCQGQGCKACAQRGLLGKFRWDVTVPREHKEAVARLVEKERER